MISRLDPKSPAALTLVDGLEGAGEVAVLPAAVHLAPQRCRRRAARPGPGPGRRRHLASGSPRKRKGPAAALPRPGGGTAALRPAAGGGRSRVPFLRSPPSADGWQGLQVSRRMCLKENIHKYQPLLGVNATQSLKNGVAREVNEARTT